MNISKFFIDRPIFAGVLSILVLLAGLLAMFQLPISEYPEVVPPSVVVRAQYPGANPKVIAETVASPLEESINGVEDMLYMQSQANSDGNLTLTVNFKLGVDPDKAQQLVQNRVSQALPRLPPDVQRLGVTTAKSSPTLTLVVHLISPNDRYDITYLRNYAILNVKDRLARITGVGEVTVWGSGNYSMRVWLDPQKVAQRGMTASEVVAAIREQNVQVAAGVIGASPTQGDVPLQLNVNARGRLQSEEEFKDIILKTSPDGAVTYLSDVARVELDAQEYGLRSLLDNKQAVGMGIMQSPGANALDVSSKVRAAMAELSQDFPPGVEYRIEYDPTQFVRSSIEAVVHTLLEAIALVVLVVILFLQTWRASIIPLLAVPVSIVGTFALLLVFGYSINALSLFGMVLAIGIVVDDAIVVVENVERNIAAGLSPRDATYRAMREVSGPIIAIALTLCAVFVPLAFMTGLTGQFYKQFAVTITTATVISLVVSVAIIPALCARWLKPGATPHASPARPSRMQAAFARLHDGYGASLARVLGHARLTLLVLAGVIGLNVYLYVDAPKGFLPVQDTGQLVGFVRGDDGFSFQVMQPKIDQYRQLVLKHPAVQDVIGYNGGGLGISNSLFLIRLKPVAQRAESSTEVINWLRMNAPPVPGGMFFLNVDQDLRMPGGFGNSGDHELAIMASDVPALREWSRKISKAMQSIPELRDVDAVGDGATQQVVINIDRSAAQRLGVDMDTISSVLSNSFSQRQVATLYDAMNQYRVVL
ncbi:MAG TPA: multidrug efflux RND transporter permease subunit, partial [Achromobacter sp.]|nr:multidrug efflux RND transporter permease subunit [Achromobacter sp.]